MTQGPPPQPVPPGSPTPDESALSVLVVDDEVWIAEELAFGLEENGLPVTIASSAATAHAVLAESDRIGVVVTDIRMPGEDGLALVRRLMQNRPDAQAVETVVMTGHATIDDAVAAVRAGAFDFVRKPFTLDEMTAVVVAARRRAAAKRREARARATGQQMLAAAEAEREAARAVDPLTGLPNRAAFAAHLGGLAAAPPRHHAGPTVIVLDIDGFATVNEANGTAAGDLVLRETAQRLRQLAGEEWFFARIGSDEFAAASTLCASEAEAMGMAERIRAAVEEPLSLGGDTLRPAASLGVVHGAPPGGGELDAAAQLACSVARREGGSRSVLWTPAMQEAAQRRLAILQDLPRGIARDEISVQYQPIHALPDRRLVGFEALLRWHHASLGPVAPDEFIAVAEEGRLILELGAWVLRTAARQAAAWRAILPQPPYIAVNLSGRQLAEQDVARLFAETLDAAGLPASALVAEMTETVALGAEAAEAVDALRAQGVRVALDDFGAGYSSLGVLGSLALDTVKLDRTLMTRVATDARERRLLNGLVATIRTLGLEVVAEGIETEGQLEVARAAGCTAVQGYLLGRPLAAAAATQLVEAMRG